MVCLWSGCAGWLCLMMDTHTAVSDTRYPCLPLPSVEGAVMWLFHPHICILDHACTSTIGEMEPSCCY